MPTYYQIETDLFQRVHKQLVKGGYNALAEVLAEDAKPILNCMVWNSEDVKRVLDDIQRECGETPLEGDDPLVALVMNAALEEFESPGGTETVNDDLDFFLRQWLDNNGY